MLPKFFQQPLFFRTGFNLQKNSGEKLELPRSHPGFPVVNLLDQLGTFVMLMSQFCTFLFTEVHRLSRFPPFLPNTLLPTRDPT